MKQPLTVNSYCLIRNLTVYYNAYLWILQDVCIVGDFNELVEQFGSEISVVADLSDCSDRTSDSEISKADFGTCMRCGKPTKNYGFRLCLVCFRVRILCFSVQAYLNFTRFSLLMSCFLSASGT